VKMDDLVPEAGNLESFIKQFEVFAGAPGGVEKLREMILKLAVAGKLHKHDETSSSKDLLIKLRSERAALIKEKKIRKGKPLPEINDEPFIIPDHWLWVRLGEWGNWGSGATPSRSISTYYGGSIPWFKSGELTGGVIMTSQETITDEAVTKSAVKLCPPGDVLIAMYGATIGKTAILGVNATTNQAVCACTCFIGVENTYLLLLLKALNSNFIKQGAGGAQPNISRDKIINTPAPLPPLEEQKRIVAKVDELMSLCDTLEAQQQQQAKTVLRANTAAINALLNPAPQSEQNSPKTTEKETSTTPENSFEHNWQRIAQHFNTLYGCTLPMPKGQGRKKKYLVGLENVKALRQLVLQMGCSGLLIDSSKFPDSRDYLIKLGIDGFDKENFGQIPENWSWVKLNELSEFITSGSRGWKKFFSKNGDTFIRSQDIKYDKLFCEDKAYVSLPESVEGKRTRVSDGNILITITGANVGKCALISGLNEKAYVSQHVALIRLISTDYAVYLHKWLTNEFGGRLILVGDSYGDKPGLNLKQIGALSVPFPSIEEQKCIVAKVDQLMTLCDQLEQQLTQSYSDAEKLMQATVKTLTA